MAKSSKNNRARAKQQIDYAAIELPDPETKPYPKWSYVERRAYILRRIVELGGSRLVNRTEIARLFDKSNPQLTFDIQALDQYIAGDINSTQVKSTVLTAFEKAFRDLQQRDQAVEAYELALSFARYMQSIGVLETEPNRIDLSGPVEIIIQRRPQEES